MSSTYEDLRLAGDFCDAVLKVQHVEFQVHKVIMCNCSSYFGALFRRWSTPNKRVYDVNYIEPEIMGHIIEFAYTGSFSVTMDNVEDVMFAAHQYDIMGMVQTCKLFMEQQLCPDNCIGIWKFTTSACHCPDLQSKADRYILDHFEEVVLSEEFLLLTVEELTYLFGRDELIVRTETIVYESMMRWINHMPDQRGGHIHQLLSKIRLCLMDSVYFTNNVLTNVLVGTNNPCRAIVREVKSLQGQWLNQRGNIGFFNYFFRQRLPGAILLATGGWSRGDPTNAIEAYDTHINHWVSVEPGAERPRAYHGTAFLDGFIYFIGGFNREEYFCSVQRFDPVGRVWREMSSMKCSRCYVSVTTLNGCIYALGGFNGRVRLSSAECYQPQTNEWNHISSMIEERSDASCTTFQGMVYICGGFNGLSTLQSAEYYNPETDEWTMISPMRSHRSGLGVVACRDCIYAVGGNLGSDGNNRLRTVEAYTPQTDTWTNRSPMTTTRSNFGIQVVEDRIFAVGGFDGIGTSTAVEAYDPELDEWTVASDMGNTRSALSCCVVYGLPNMAEYTINRDSLQNLQLEGVEEQEE